MALTLPCPTSPRAGFQESFALRPSVQVADDFPYGAEILDAAAATVTLGTPVGHHSSETQTSPRKRGEYLKERKSTKYFVARVPKSAYSVAAIMPVLAEVNSCYDWFRVCMLSYMGVIINALFQLSFVRGIREITVKHGALTCEDLAMDPDLVILCVVVYLLSIWNDIEETFDMAELYFDLIPTVRGRSETLGFDDDNNVISGGMSILRKVAIGVFILLLKLIIALCLANYGVTYLVSSANDSELLLNTLALEFILSVDEMIYDSMAPMSTRSLMKQLPPFKTNTRRPFFRWADSIGPLVKVTFCFWISRFAMEYNNPGTAECVRPAWWPDRRLSEFLGFGEE
eukprot:TRINITY_DN9803_c0_g1_i1.p1 TRINITY_DN9803_c0_g1~~TRINITY_DN9803_c0_g1_i1.p1  ORF type:complete len:343 (+),score=35.80 TRINITY_DN9803_c0_g1_i1:45-1073(+)